MERSLRVFVNRVYAYYTKEGRHNLPWRKTRDPYHILVSELMLQQTQVDRVMPKFRAFTKRYPTFAALAKAPLRDVLLLWQGLGYNRRAKYLHECAKAVTELYRGRLPEETEILRSLPGIGPYTCNAIQAFAFNKPVIMIETNIRSVYIHHFFSAEAEVTDQALFPLIEQTLDSEKPRTWYYALMDYGSYIKRVYGNPNIRSKHYTKQSKFHGSVRQMRGGILKMLSERTCKRTEFHDRFSHMEDVQIDAELERLVREGLVVARKDAYMLPD